MTDNNDSVPKTESNHVLHVVLLGPHPGPVRNH